MLFCRLIIALAVVVPFAAMPFFLICLCSGYSPAERSQDEIHDEECADQDQADEVDPRPRVAHRVVNLGFKPNQKQKSKQRKTCKNKIEVKAQKKIFEEYAPKV